MAPPDEVQKRALRKIWETPGEASFEIILSGLSGVFIILVCDLAASACALRLGKWTICGYKLHTTEILVGSYLHEYSKV